MRRSAPWLFLGAALAAASALAETAYVSDRLVITIRSSPSSQAEILRHLNTGDAVEVLERRAQNDFVRVRADDGVEGWALAQYLMPAPAARDALVTAERAAAQARSEASRLRARLSEVEAADAQSSEELRRVLSSNDDLTQRLEEVTQASANALLLRDENAELARRLQEQQLEIERLVRDSAAISDASKREWFLVGAGVLIAGIALGLLLPRLRRRKRWEW